MMFDELKPAKRSLGSLRKAEKTKPRSPDFTGTLNFSVTPWKQSQNSSRRAMPPRWLAV